MGVAQAGIVFRASPGSGGIDPVLGRLWGGTLKEIAHPNRGEFDIRNDQDVMVETFGDVYFVANDKLVRDHLSGAISDFKALYDASGRPEVLVLYCCFDSGGTHGYAIVRDGACVRTRIQTIGRDGTPSIQETGDPSPEELRWLNAPSFREESEDPPEMWPLVYYQGAREHLVLEEHLTRQLLFDVLIATVGICPWETEERPTYRFFKVAGRPWWKLWG